MSRQKSRGQYYALMALIIFSIFSFTASQIPPASALTAGTVTPDDETYTSFGTYSLHDIGGGTWTDGTYVYIAESNGARMQIGRYNIATQDLQTAVIPWNWVSAPTDPSTAVGSSTKNDIVVLQALGGTTQQTLTGGITFTVEYANGATGDLVGKVVNEIHLWLKKTGAPTGTATIAVFDSTGATTCLFGTQDVSLLTTGFVEKTYTKTGAPCTIANGDRIGTFFNAGSAGNTFDIEYVAANRYDGTTLAILQTATGAQGAATWTSQTAREVKFQLGYNHLATLVDDDVTTSSWENAGYVVRGTQTDFDTSTTIRSGAATIAAEKVAGGTLSGASYDQVEIFLSKTGSPTGTATVGRFDASGVIQDTCNTIDVSTLTTTAFRYTFTCPNDDTLTATTYIGIEYTGGDGSNNVQVHRSGVDIFDGAANAVFTSFTSGTPTDVTTSDLGFRIVDTQVGDQEASANIYIDLGSALAVGGVSLFFPDATKIPQIVDIASSPDAAVWTDRRADVTLAQTTGLQNIELLSAAVSARYWRVQVDTYGSGDNSIEISEFDAIEASIGSAGILGRINGDATIAGGNCDASGDGCSNGGDGHATRVDLDAVFDSNSYTLASRAFTISAGFRLTTVGESSDDFVYLLETDCTCVQNNYNLKRAPYDLSSGFAAYDSFTDATEPGDSNGQSTLLAYDGGAEDIIYWFIRPGNAQSSTEIAVYKTDTTATTTELAGIADDTPGEPVVYKDDEFVYVLLQKDTGDFSDRITYSYNIGTDAQDSDEFDSTSFPLGNQGAATSTAWTLTSNLDFGYIANQTKAHRIELSSGDGFQAPTFVEDVEPSTGTLTLIGNSKYYYFGNGLYISASTTTSQSWTFKQASGTQIELTLYNEVLNVPLQLMTDDTLGWENDVLRIACDGYYHLPSNNVTVGSYSDCEQYTTQDIEDNPIGRELPFVTPKNIVWTSEYTNYNIHVTVTSGDAEDFDANIVYDGKDVDRNHFDAGDNVQVRLLYGQCYTLQFIEVLSGDVVQSSNICADDVIFKEALLSTTLGFVFWSSPWGVTHTVNCTSHEFTVITHHTPAPYNFTTTVYNSTSNLILNDTTINASDPDSVTYDLDTFIVGDFDDNKPFTLYVFDENGMQRYKAYLCSTGGWLGDIATIWGDFNFAGWGLLMFLPLIFAAMFTRNTAGIGGTMVVALIGSLVFFGVLELGENVIWLLTIVAGLGILAYRVLGQ